MEEEQRIKLMLDEFLENHPDVMPYITNQTKDAIKNRKFIHDDNVIELKDVPMYDIKDSSWKAFTHTIIDEKFSTDSEYRNKFDELFAEYLSSKLMKNDLISQLFNLSGNDNISIVNIL